MVQTSDTAELEKLMDLFAQVTVESWVGFEDDVTDHTALLETLRTRLLAAPGPVYGLLGTAGGIHLVAVTGVGPQGKALADFIQASRRYVERLIDETPQQARMEIA